MMEIRSQDCENAFGKQCDGCWPLTSFKVGQCLLDVIAYSEWEWTCLLKVIMNNEQDYILRGVHDTHNISLQLVIVFL